MSRYTVNGTTVFVTNDLDAPEVYNRLPTATYVVGCSPLTGWFLSKIEDFELPAKLYGDTHQKAERFLNTFEDRPGVTGVLLSGSKGSGKTLVMKTTSLLGLKRDIPTLVINSPYSGEGFNKFIQSIDQPCVMIFDEFEKLYDGEQQEQLLTLLDGTFATKKLCIATCNDPYKIDSHMTNRPGRMFYYLKYAGVTEAFIREYCTDRLNDLSKTDSIVTLSSMFREFNFDMLKAVVEELNRYPEESVKQVVDILNVNYDYGTRIYYDVTIESMDGTKLPTSMFTPNIVCNPIQEDRVAFTIYGKSRTSERPITKERYEYGPDADSSDDDMYEDSLDVDSDEDGDGGYKIVRQVMIPMQNNSKLKISHDLALITVRDEGTPEKPAHPLRVIFTKQVKQQFDYMSLLY